MGEMIEHGEKPELIKPRWGNSLGMTVKTRRLMFRVYEVAG
jgi:hypothetical protein